MSTEPEGFGAHFEQCNSIQTLWPLLLNSFLLDANDFCLSGPVTTLKPRVNGVDCCLIEYLSTAPLDFVSFIRLGVNDSGFHSPIWFGHKFLDFLCLINAEAESWGLAWAVC